MSVSDPPDRLFDFDGEEFIEQPRLIQEETGDRARRRAQPVAPDRSKRPPGKAPGGISKTGAEPPTRDQDAALWAVRDRLLELDPHGRRTAAALRWAYDRLYDGRSTGRWDYTQLSKTEKTHLGSMVEIAIQREFGFDPGDDLDFSIQHSDVDCKWSGRLYKWMIPQEMYTTVSQIAMVIWANEYSERWCLGLVRIEERLLMSENQDSKRVLTPEGCDRILWVHRSREMIPNVLIRHPEVALKLADQPTGQKAVNTLFREIQREPINRAAVETAGQQVDSGKRVRDARIHLAKEGIVVFGHSREDPDMAEGLGLPRPTLGRFVSARVAPAEPGTGGVVEIAGCRWRLAQPDEVTTKAPRRTQEGWTVTSA